jgi:hypothetical protein
MTLALGRLILAHSRISRGDIRRSAGRFLQEVAPFFHIQLPFLQAQRNK